MFIIGTNGSGKSTTARAIIERFGGIETATKRLTTCRQGSVCFAGAYREGSAYGGVDSLDGTKVLREVVEEGLKTNDTIFCEGSFLGSFGINTTTALMSAEGQLVVFLYSSLEVINQRLRGRSGGSITPSVAKKQRGCLATTRKYQSIGIPVLPIDTGAFDTERRVDIILEHLHLQQAKI